ncbi:hypothetical protein HYW30_00235 [Candidatus Azambacteria bacterium]|nr:hypothetical protein [Candidatus Azambacteria bacterium]
MLDSRGRSAFHWLIFVIVLFFGFLIVWSGYVGTKRLKVGEEPSAASLADEKTGALKTLGSSDEIGDLEQEAAATNLEGLDAELSAIEKQLK